jgi:hypothetical protein
MTDEITYKRQHVLIVIGICCISGLVFLFNRIADGLAFHCLEYVPAGLGEGCVQGVTSEPWRAAADASMVMVILLPCVTYTIAIRNARALTITIVSTVAIAILSAFIFLWSTLLNVTPGRAAFIPSTSPAGNRGDTFLEIFLIGLPCITYLVGKRTRTNQVAFESPLI